MKTDLGLIKVERQRRMCPEHRYNRVAGCEPCKAFTRWQRAQKKTGNASLVPITKQMRDKVGELLDAGLTLLEISKMIGSGPNLTTRLCQSGRRRGRPGRPRADDPYRAKSIHVLHARNLMACKASDLPLLRRAQVDATGLRRRLDILALRKFSATWVTQQLGLSDSVTTRWRRRRWVPGWHHVKVKELFESIPRNAIGPGVNAGVIGAVRRGALPDRYWTDELIDDPGYDPLKPVGPVGVRRRLRALYREGKGPVFLGAMLGESPETVASWTVDGPVPGYARHLVSAVYERWAGPARGADRVPHDQAATDLAVREGWPSSLAWEDASLDDPLRSAKETGPRASRKRTDVEQELVRQAIAGGVRRSELTKDETVLVVQALAERGFSARKIGVHLRWWSSDDLSDAAKSRAAKDAASAFVRRERIRLHGSTSEAIQEARELLAAA